MGNWELNDYETDSLSSFLVVRLPINILLIANNNIKWLINMSLITNNSIKWLINLLLNNQ